MARGLTIMNHDYAQSPQDYFRLILVTVVGQAYGAAGYALQDRPLQWVGGFFQFMKPLEDGLFGWIDYQLLAYVDTEWAARNPSRFRVTLTRTDNAQGKLTNHPRTFQRDLSALVVEDYGVSILPSAAHWWTFQTTDELGKALAEAGHLVIGYGIPTLSGDLTPSDDLSDG
jgi:hypothetical protein